MLFEVRSVNTAILNGEINGVQVVYSAKNESRSAVGNGNYDLTVEEYEGNEAISQLEEISRQKLLELIPTLTFAIRSINTRYREGQLSNVQISYGANNETRSASFNGHFDLTEEEHEENKSMDQLKELAKQILTDEVNAE
ncbi:hypothetical protein M3E13_19510 [Oceanobacillus kimchii]|uniref:hypothetical protein n=1 Tax=Oceanobacillus kimchii TaxID=746691 RepID=UPI0021A37422|nr:hypothetical protein [Oceanobacillus kimchii]MCT1575707.1 hypothetical protein [Oceanobacillus kimchii]MCT2138088.1 hypothetical protein [Oceanobacillus kimchii]